MLTTSDQAKVPWSYTAGLILAFVATFGGWYDPASFTRVNAWHFGIWQSCDIPHPSFKLLSFGVAVAIVVLLAWLTRRAGNVRGMYAMAAILVFLAVAFVIQIAFTRASWLDGALRGAADFNAAVYFTGDLNPPISFDSPPDRGITITPQQGMMDRLFAARDCLTYGWIVFLGGSLLAFFTAGRMLPNNAPARRTKRWLALIFALILAFQVTSPLISQGYLVKGDRAAAMDRPAEAEVNYRHAIAWDEWYRLQPILFLRIGELRQSRGDQTSPTARLYLAEQNAANGSYLLAMDLLEKADVRQDPAIAIVLREEIGRLALAQGQTSYTAGQIETAYYEWLRAAQAVPNQVAVYAMLGQVSTYLSNYAEAEGWYAQGERLSGVPTTRAICLTGTGDTYYLRADMGTARSFYLRSLAAFFDDNYRSVKSLQQDYFR